VTTQTPRYAVNLSMLFTEVLELAGVRRDTLDAMARRKPLPA
jgi:hypothetical protein